MLIENMIKRNSILPSTASVRASLLYKLLVFICYAINIKYNYIYIALVMHIYSHLSVQCQACPIKALPVYPPVITR